MNWMESGGKYVSPLYALIAPIIVNTNSKIAKIGIKIKPIKMIHKRPETMLQIVYEIKKFK